LRWSAAYFRCLSLDVLPPVKPRYEHENVFGCLTKGYLKVLLSQVSGDEFEGFCGWTEKLFVSCHVLACYQILASVAAQALITISLEFLSCSTLKFVLIFSTRAFQVGKGFFIRRDILDHRWNGLCLPEVNLLVNHFH
jgi:hypothetical protein